MCAELLVVRSLDQAFTASSVELVWVVQVVVAVLKARRCLLERWTANVGLVVLVDTAEQRPIAVVASRCRLDKNLRAVAKRNAIARSRTSESIACGCADVATFAIVGFHIFRFDDYVI